MASSYVFKCKPKVAQYLLQDKDLVNQAKQIKDTGIALFTPTTDDSELVRLPFAPRKDMEYVYRLISTEEPVIDVTPNLSKTDELTPETC